MSPDDDPIAEAAYDEMAGEYDEDIETNAYNAHLEFPGTSSLVPDVDGNRVLDAGCGTGMYTAWLLEQGADVVGVDVSEEMLARAREKVGDRVEFHRADLGEPLEFLADDAFAGVLSALALSYVRDWRAVFAEFARVLEPGGFLVFSTGHPMDTFPGHEESNYFEVERRTKEWAVEVPYYRRSFGEMVNPLVEAGFRVDRVLEPQPTAEFEAQRPDRYEKESRTPVFLCVRAVRE
jgi:ubiquinone/menaquinone biosynthesis C-methylase UbiE